MWNFLDDISLKHSFTALLLADFSNVISKQDLKFLAEADEQEVVREIQVGANRFLNQSIKQSINQ